MEITIKLNGLIVYVKRKISAAREAAATYPA